MFEGNIRGTEDVVWYIIEWKLMAACSVSCYWLSLPPSVVFYRKKKDFYFSPFSESARRTDWDWESLYKNHGFTHLRKCFMWKAHTIFLKCHQKYQKRVFKHSNPQIFLSKLRSVLFFLSSKNNYLSGKTVQESFCWRCCWGNIFSWFRINIMTLKKMQQTKRFFNHLSHLWLLPGSRPSARMYLFYSAIQIDRVFC